MLELGTKAPDFELPDQNGEMHKLSDYAGKKVILYFYPKDNTPGCTKQACGFSERYPQFTEKGAVILGVSKDSVASHKRFEEKYGLAFTLLSNGYYHNADKEIVIKKGLSESQTLKTAIHETVHAKLHDKEIMESLGCCR